jgi:hypothetical protein
LGRVKAGAVSENLDAGVAMRLGVGENAEDTNKFLRVQRQRIGICQTVVQGGFEEGVEYNNEENYDPQAGR